MGHIHTKPGEHDHTASAYVFRLDGNEPRVILHLHKKLHRYMQFGGHIETTENPWQAIIHELLEESGYEMSQLKILQPQQRLKNDGGEKLHPVPIYHNTHEFSKSHLHTDVCYAFVTDQEPKHIVGEHESTKIKLFNKQELMNLSDERQYPWCAKPDYLCLMFA